MAWCLLKRCKYYETAAFKGAGVEELLQDMLSILSKLKKADKD
jgi:hypothetical protein